MQLGRLTQNIVPTVDLEQTDDVVQKAADTITSAADSTPVQSLTGVTQRVNPNLALYQTQEEAKKLLEAVTQLTPNPALYPIPRPVPPTPDPLGLHAPIQFRPSTLAARGGLGVVLTHAGGIKPGDLLADARTETDILNRARQAGLKSR